MARHDDGLVVLGRKAADDDGYEGDEDDDDEDGMDVDETEEEVEILVSFEENGQEYHLVRLLDPVLLVGRVSISI